MAVQHIVLLEWNEDASEEQRAACVAELVALKDSIPGIQSITAGENFSERAQGFNHGAIVTFDDRESLAGYGPHPAHQALVDNLGPLLKNLLTVDIEE